LSHCPILQANQKLYGGIVGSDGLRYFNIGLRPETTSEDIYSACKDGDEYYCKEWAMNPDHDLNQSDQHGFTPLHYACMYGHGNIVEMFLMRGARTDITNMGGDSLLHLAAAHGKYDVIMKLMRMQPDVNLANEHGNTPLHYASFWNFIGICEVRVEVQSQDFRCYNLQ